jgi:two-component system, NarL family, nitrate/nitrite response regulator NarL
LRSGIENWLEQSRFDVVASVATFEEIRPMRVADGMEALLLIDGTVGHAPALQDLKTFQSAHSGGRGVMLVDSYEPQNLVAAYQEGIDGYLTTSISQEVLLSYLSLTMLGELMIPSSALDMLRETAQLWHSAEVELLDEASTAPWDGVERRARYGLTLREASILRCLMDGDSNKVIARKCDIREATVKVHIKTILRKINVKNRTQAALWATAHLDRVERRLNRQF